MPGNRTVFIDTETDGLRWFGEHRPFLIGYSIDNGPVDIIDLRTTDVKTTQFPLLLLDPEVTKVFHNATFDLHMLRAIGLNWGGQVIDTMHLAHLDGHEFLGLEKLTKKIFPKRGEWKDEVKKYLGKEKARRTRLRKKGEDLPEPTYADVPDEIIKPYLIRDVVNTRCLFKHFWRRVYGTSKHQIRVESALIPVVMRMEEKGMEVEEEYFRFSSQCSARTIEMLQSDFENRFGEGFNPEAPADLSRALFETLKLEPTKLTPKGKPSTDKTVLETYKDNPMVGKILEFRAITKMKGTYYDGILDRATNSTIHCSFRQNGARTGRFSCTQPNLQNIPRDDTSVRRGFVPRNGHVLVLADYSQMELRLLAHYSLSQPMLNGYAQGLDFHEESARLMGCDRNAAKTINFGILYGMGVNKLAAQLKVEVEEAKALRARWNEVYPAAKKLMDSIVRDIRNVGFTQDIYGKRYYVPSDKAYKGLNYLIQGTGAQILKRALIGVDARMREEFGEKCYPVNTVHDEIIFECDEELWEKRGKEVTEVITDEMVEDNMFALTLPVDVSVAKKCWAEKEEVVYA